MIVKYYGYTPTEEEKKNLGIKGIEAFCFSDSAKLSNTNTRNVSVWLVPGTFDADGRDIVKAQNYD